MKFIIPLSLVTAVTAAFPAIAQVQDSSAKGQNNPQPKNSEVFVETGRKQLESELDYLPKTERSQTVDSSMTQKSSADASEQEDSRMTIYDFFDGVQGHDSPELLINSNGNS